MITDKILDEYDFVVVGSGAGGGPVAANLAKAGYHVLLLEAGGRQEPIDYKVPAFHSLSSEHRDLAWKFYVHHYADANQERRDRNFIDNKKIDGAIRNGVFYPRAGTLGGCTAHHAMIFIAPHNSDWNYIAKVTGDKSWNAKSMRKYSSVLSVVCIYDARGGEDLTGTTMGITAGCQQQWPIPPC